MAEESRGYLFHVDATSIMLFASAIGETNRIYYDSEFAAGTPLGSVVAPPTFAISTAQWDPGYPLRGVRRIPAAPPRSDGSTADGAVAVKPRGGSADSGGALARGLHGEQRFQYHKPVVPGMKLRVTSRRGESWEKEGRRGGTMRFSETITEYRDAEGELVVTATSVGIQTSKVVEG